MMSVSERRRAAPLDVASDAVDVPRRCSITTIEGSVLEQGEADAVECGLEGITPIASA